MNLPCWRLDEITSRDHYEVLLARAGGPELASQIARQRAACEALEATLSPAQRDLYLACSDATTDAASMREAAGARVGLCFGAGIGAALARSPDLDVSALVEVASRVIDAVLCARLPPADAREVVATVLAALDRAATSAAEATRAGAQEQA